MSLEIIIAVVFVIGIIVIVTMIFIILKIKQKRRDLTNIVRGIASTLK